MAWWDWINPAYRHTSLKPVLDTAKKCESPLQRAFFWFSSKQTSREECGHSRSRLRVRERVLGMSCVAALIPATDVGYDGVRLVDLDFERRNERILGLDENVIRLSFEFEPDSELRRHLPPPPILAQESFSLGSPAATNPFCGVLRCKDY